MRLLRNSLLFVGTLQQKCFHQLCVTAKRNSYLNKFTGAIMILCIIVYHIADELMIRYHDDLIIPGNSPCGTKTDLDHSADLIFDLNNIPYMKALVNKNGNPSNYILKEFPQCQTQSHEKCSRSGEQQNYVYTCRT